MRKILLNTMALGMRRTTTPKFNYSRLVYTLMAYPVVQFGFSRLDLTDSYELTFNDDLKEGEMREFQVGPQKEDAVLVCKVKGQYYCVSNSCPHYGAPLSAGLLVGDKVKCPFHNASFSVVDGSFEDGPMFNGLETFPVAQVDGKLSVKIPKELLNKNRQLTMATRGDDPTHYVIIGGGVSGQSAAETLRQGGFTGRITIISGETNLPYDRTPISKGLFQIGIEKLMVRNQQFYEQYGIDVLTNTTVQSVDVNHQHVTVGGQQIHFDKLLIATGATARKPQVDGINLGNIFTLRTFQDAMALKEQAKKAKNIVIVGASFIGLETASVLKKEFKDDVNITVVDSSDVPFQRVLGSEVGAALQKLHEQNGIKFELASGLKRFGGAGQVTRVDLKNGKSLEADLVVVGAGVIPNTQLIKEQLKLSQNGGIETDVFLKAKNNVYVAGDVASYPYWVTGDNVRIEHHNEAIHQGYVAALNMLGRPTPLTDIPFFWTRQWDKSLQYSGVGNGFDEVIVDGDLSQHKFVAYYARHGRVVASASMNTPNAQMIISEALRLNCMPHAKELKDKKVTLDEIKTLVQSKGASCGCKRASQCQSKL